MYEYKCELKRIIDGDTIVLTIDLGLSVYTVQTIRIYGINAPELRGPEAERAREAAAFVGSWFMRPHESFTVQTFRRAKNDSKKGKYGRYLGRIYNGDDDLGEEMIDRGLARKY